MSSPLRNGAPSPPPDHPAAAPNSPHELSLAALVRARGAPLIEALERHRPGAREHAEATGAYAFAAAVELGLDRSGTELAREGAKLHEVGKVYVPAEILAKRVNALGPEERSQLDRHHEAGYRLARGAGIPDQVCGWILRFRERFDGTGPERLAGDGIPVEVRIARAACVCHQALAASAAAGEGPDRCRAAAVAELRAAAGGELDPTVVGALEGVLGHAVGGRG